MRPNVFTEIHKVSRFIETVIATTCHYRKLLANNSLRRDSILQSERSSMVKFVRWSPPTMKQKFKINTHASLSEQYIFLGYVLFDHRGIHLLRRAKAIKIENEKPNIVEAEARVLELALFDLQERGWLPIVVQLGCAVLSEKLVGPSYSTITSKELWNIIEHCKQIIDEKSIQVYWTHRRANVFSNSLMESVRMYKNDICATELDPRLCRFTWDQMFGPFKPYLSKTTNTCQERLKYLLSDEDGFAQNILSWIYMALNREKIPREIIFEISTTKGVQLVERYLMSITPANNKSSYPTQDQVIHMLIDILEHLKPIPIPRTIVMYLQFEDKIKLLPNDLFESCSSEDLTIKSHPPHFFYHLGAIRFESLVVTLRVLSYYAPGLCIRRLKFGPRKNYSGKEDIEVTLKELVEKGILVEKKPDLYMIQREHVPQPIHNDFIVEDLKDEYKKDDEIILYNYKVVKGIDF
ncbi:uncharacterized protein LOC132166741 isoform X2 [Corylus avellana]|uniref:uncharacterized protein LOC132166741 isoform X2 n=1 Tax=Corylus avellana TaxID=13451 RepID=UPI00286BE385|nr:uncharacterized protein LOC132166741 isoform X2 [Corylus avellana]